MIGQFRGPYSLHGPLNFTTYEANISLKLSFTLNCANDLKNDFKLTCFAFDLVQKSDAVPREWKSVTNQSNTNRDIINILLTSSSRSIL